MENTQVNIVETITQTINNLFSNLFNSVDNSLYSVLDDLLFINSDIFSNNYFSKLFGSSNSNGIILICNSLLIGFVLYYISLLIISYFTYNQVQRPSQFIFKLFFCALSINFSEFIVKEIVVLFSNISLSIREVGEIVFDKSICLSVFIQDLNSTIYLEENAFNIFSLDGLIKSFVSIGFLNLAITYSVRYIMINVFCFLSPFAFVSLINTSTSWIFKSWIKLLISLLILQIFVPLILLVSFSIKLNSSDIFSKIIYIGSIYSLAKGNSFVRDFMGGLSTDVSIGFSNLKNIVSK